MDHLALKALWLTGTHVRGLSLDGAEISGSLLADRSGLVDMRTTYHEQLSAVIHPIEGPMMSDKSPRKSMSKKSGKSLKEKRADKKGKASEHTVIETAFHAKKR